MPLSDKEMQKLVLAMSYPRDGMPKTAQPINPSGLLKEGLEVHFPKGAPILHRRAWHARSQEFNCYAYALRLMRHGWAEPGQLRRQFNQHVERWNVNRLDMFIRHDGLERIAPHGGARDDHILAAFYSRANSDNDADYHFYSYDSNGLWSHKPGKSKPKNKDAGHELIADILGADRDNGFRDYSELVGFYRIPKQGLVYRVKPEYAHLPR